MKLTAVVGTIVNVRVAFTNPDDNDAAYDPNAVSLSMRTPAGVTTEYVYGTDAALELESAGHYLFRLTLSEESTYRWTWTGSSPQRAVVIRGNCDSVGGLD